MRKNKKTMTAVIMASAAVLGSTMICGASDTEKLKSELEKMEQTC